MNDKTLTVGLMIFILLIVALITRNGDIAWMILPFLVYLGAGILQTPDLEKLSFSVKRTLEQTRSKGILSIVVGVSVQNTALETVHIAIHEATQAGMKITDGELSQYATLKPEQFQELNYSFTATREIIPGSPSALW